MTTTTNAATQNATKTWPVTNIELARCEWLGELKSIAAAIEAGDVVPVPGTDAVVALTCSGIKADLIAELVGLVGVSVRPGGPWIAPENAERAAEIITAISMTQGLTYGSSQLAHRVSTWSLGALLRNMPATLVGDTDELRRRFSDDDDSGYEEDARS